MKSILTFFLCTSTLFAMTGTVLDNQGNPLANALVYLQEAGDSTMTDGDGMFSLAPQAPVAITNHSSLMQARIQQNQVLFQVFTAQKIQLRTLNAQGKVMHAQTQNYSPGLHTWQPLSQASPGMYFVQIQQGHQSTQLSFVVNEKGHIFQSQTPFIALPKTAEGILDSLVIEKGGLRFAVYPIEDYLMDFGNMTVISPVCENPVVLNPSGTFTEPFSISANTPLDGASLYYTLDGSTPSASSTPYTGQIFVDHSLTLKMIAIKEGLKPSEVVTRSYEMICATPTLSLRDVRFDDPWYEFSVIVQDTIGPFSFYQKMTLSSTTPGALIYYTTDGSTPTTSSSLYTDTILITEFAQVRAIAAKDQWSSSPELNKDLPFKSGHFTDPRDQRSYKWISLGNQTWMAENLAYLPQVNSPTDFSDTVAKIYVYGYQGTDLSEAKVDSMYLNNGALYNYQAAKTSCPTGWHLPTMNEYIRERIFSIKV